jgi:hypothetical protein
MDGLSHSYPEFRAAIRDGWVVLVGGNVSDYIPQSANVQVRAAQGKPGKQASTEVQQDETYAGPARKPTTTTQDGVRIETKKFNAALVKDTEGDGRSVGPTTKKASVSDQEAEAVSKVKSPSKRSFTVDGSTSMNADPEGLEQPDITDVPAHTVKAKSNALEIPKEGLREGQSSEDGAVVANLKSSTRRKVVLTDARTLESEINKIENTIRKAAPSKVTVTKTGALTGASGTVEELLEANDNPGKVIADQKRAKALAEQRRAERLAAVQASETKLVQEDTTPKVVDVSPPPGAIEAPEPPPKVEAKKPTSIAEIAVHGTDLELAPGFRWDKSLHWKTRVKNALQYRDDPEKLNLIRGYEVPSVVKQIDAELAK